MSATRTQILRKESIFGPLSSAVPLVNNGERKMSVGPENGQFKSAYRNNIPYGDKILKKKPKLEAAKFDDFSIPIKSHLLTCFVLLLNFFLGFVYEIFTWHIKREKDRDGYVQLYSSWEPLYKAHLVRRCWFGLNIPICSPAGPIVRIMERESPDNGWTIKLTDKTQDCINLGSFNYLNLSEPNSPLFPITLADLKTYGVSTCSPRNEFGTSTVHEELDIEMAKFLKVEDAMTFGMGYATNALNIPAIVDEDCLVFSDQFNHTSIVAGIRISKAKICVFKHNDVKDLEEKIRESLISGNNGKPWKKLLIIIEGVYSMHGSIARLPEIVDIKKKYGAYLYLDEAHSIGCLGEKGRGAAEYLGVNPKDIDIMMATLAKSFGAIGGYIGGSKELISLLRARSIAYHYGCGMPVNIASFVLQGVKFLTTNPDGPLRVKMLCKISRYFRLRLRQMGYIVFGDEESPVVALIIPSGTMPYVVKYLRNKNIVAAMVSYPATEITEGRIRCCMNALNTKENIDYVLKCFDDLADRVDLRLSKVPRSQEKIEY